MTTKKYVSKVIRNDLELKKFVNWSISARADEYWKRKMNLGYYNSEKKKWIEGKIEKRLKQLYPDNPGAQKLVLNGIRGYIYMCSGTYGETSALKRAKQRYCLNTIDYTSNQNLDRLYVYNDVITKDFKQTSYYSGIISAEVDGWLLRGCEPTVITRARKRRKLESIKRPIIGVVEHKQRQADPKSNLPTIDKKQEELMQMNMYMYMTNVKQCLWVQTNKFNAKGYAPKQSLTMVYRDEQIIAKIKKTIHDTLNKLNRLYMDESFRKEILDASYDSKNNILWPQSV